MQSPFNQSGLLVLPQFILLTIGEFFVGVCGLRFLISAAPHKMQYYVYMDWYLMLGFSNLFIIVVNQLPWAFVLHDQMSYLVMIVVTSYCFLICMVMRF